MRKYLAFFKIATKKVLEYRARQFIWLFWDVGPALIMLFFWLAVFKSYTQVGNYNFASMVIYYFVVMFSRNLILTHPDVYLQQEIYTGRMNTYLSRPASVIKWKFFYELAYKFHKLIYVTPLLAACYLFFIKNQAISLSFSFTNLIFFVFSCALSFVLYYLIKFFMGILAFWFTEIEWLNGLEMLIFWFFGGLLLPLDLFPKFIQSMASFLPFKYIFYMPALGLIGRLDTKQMIASLTVQFFWLVLFVIVVKKTYKVGLKIYSAFGG